uniref:Uncharacterized protein n=1 Tax=Anguilla anguilla TaxID=7936 RepID=A0A0E9SY32_ANGAN
MLPDHSSPQKKRLMKMLMKLHWTN